MKKLMVTAFSMIALVSGNVFAQTAAELQVTGRTFMHKADYNNAILVFNRSLELSPGNIELKKDLAQAYYFAGQNDKALDVIKPVLDDMNSDDQSYQIAGNIYKQADQKGEAEKVYKKGLKKFPVSGPLYNDLGELQYFGKNYKDAIANWEKGIQLDPSYSRNYYNASRYYYFTTDKVWSLIYGEIFVNMEPRTARTTEIKEILLNGYKKIFMVTQMTSGDKDLNAFGKTFLDLVMKQSAVAGNGITPETLTAIRKNFITEWFATSGRPAFRLFEHERQLISENLFDAYNQWIFGPAANQAAYENWIKTHTEENDRYKKFVEAKVFKVPTGQYYH